MDNMLFMALTTWDNDGTFFVAMGKRSYTDVRKLPKPTEA